MLPAKKNHATYSRKCCYKVAYYNGASAFFFGGVGDECLRKKDVKCFQYYIRHKTGPSFVPSVTS